MVFETSILTIIVFLPLAGAAVVLVQPRGKDDLHRWTALAFSLAVFGLSVPLFFMFRTGEEGMQFEVSNVEWLGALGARYHVGVDGLSVLLVLLTTFLTTLSIAASWSAITKQVKAYMACFLILETGMLGAFVSLDYILFYVFWEAMLIPMYFIIGVWGGPDRIYAAIKFFLYTMFGSVLMLVGILFIYYHPWAPEGLGRSFDVLESMELVRRFPIPVSPAQLLLFGAFAVAFAIKVPMFPFHTWLPDAHVEAPTAGSVILAGVLLKMGTYGFVRFCLPLFPEASETFMPLIAVLAVVSIIYGALVSVVQPDVKKLVAYSSVSHLGFVMLGIFAFNEQGIQGAVIQMVNHGLSTGALFLLVGMLYERRHTRMIADFGGLWKQMPVFATFFMIIMLASIGLPGLNGFVGEFLVIVGAFRSNQWLAAFAATGVIFAAVYMLWMFQRVMFGKL
ncbi:MAG: NuoM family protein, partial [Armatimonadota bacterium]